MTGTDRMMNGSENMGLPTGNRNSNQTPSPIRGTLTRLSPFVAKPIHREFESMPGRPKSMHRRVVCLEKEAKTLANDFTKLMPAMYREGRPYDFRGFLWQKANGALDDLNWALSHLSGVLWSLAYPEEAARLREEVENEDRNDDCSIIASAAPTEPKTLSA